GLDRDGKCIQGQSVPHAPQGAHSSTAAVYIFFAPDRPITVMEDRAGRRGFRSGQRRWPGIDKLVPGYARRHDARLGCELYDRDGFDRSPGLSLIGASLICLEAAVCKLNRPASKLACNGHRPGTALTARSSTPGRIFKRA